MIRGSAIGKDDRMQLDGELVTVVAVISESDEGVELVVQSPRGGLQQAFVRRADLAATKVSTADGKGDPQRTIAALWATWMSWATPRIRSAVLATRPLRPYAHQDDAVFGAMLPQPRLRFLLADEPGTGKTLMTGMYLAEGRRRGLIPGKTVIIVPAHLVEKWIRELERFFGIRALKLTAEIGRDPLDLRDDVDVWIVSVDMYTYNTDVRRKVVGSRASWSLAVFDEAHRLTPTSQYLGGARQLADRAHHLLLLTATPHRGKEHFFRALLNLLDPAIYPWDDRSKDYSDELLRPGRDSFLRRMKEDLRGFDGQRLFPPRYAETRAVDLTVVEQDAYNAVMDYVDEWYDATSVLARSIYGKRAASSVAAALATLRRRADALGTPQAARVEPVVPPGFDNPSLAGADLESDDAWSDAERAVVEAKSRDRKSELASVKGIIRTLEAALASRDAPAKWRRCMELMAHHVIKPGRDGGQLLVFTEFTDTATWLTKLFAQAGYSTEILEGRVDHRDREVLQQRFLSNQFQVLVSTDAGGEGIDLQSAHVMIDWDIPWSLVRLEQRAGRLHRIGQTEPVFIYHLVAPATREGRVQQVMLDNLTAASRALNGRIYDLLDATAERAGFDFAGALSAAQRHPDTLSQILTTVPDTDVLVQHAREIVNDEDRLKSPVDTGDALMRFAQDRLQAINPVIVNGFLDQVSRTHNWTLNPGPIPGIRLLRGSPSLPPEIFPSSECLVAADGMVVLKAKAEDFRRAHEVVVLGPTEPTFQALVDLTRSSCETDLLRGATVTDLASLTSYTLFVYAAEVEHHDGVRRSRRKVPFLVRCSGAGAFEVAWESLMNLAAVGENPSVPSPAARFDADNAARSAVAAEVDRLRSSQHTVAERTRTELADIERRYKRQVRALPTEERRAALGRFASTKTERLVQLTRIEEVSATAPRLLGWVQVQGGARANSLGYDPNSEKVAVAKVVAELEALGWTVDDRQTSRLGYDLFARRLGTTDQRLVEIKGFVADLQAVTLQQHEWAQAQQRGEDYWLYVVIDCATSPRVVIRAQDPAGTLAIGPKLIESYQIPVSVLRQLMEQS